MRQGTKSQISVIIDKEGPIGASDLARRLGITPQALHRHLKTLCQQGLLEKQGTPPHTRYARGKEDNSTRSGLPPIKTIHETIGSVLGAHPGVRLVELFGSVARGEAGEKSDIDILVWLGKDEPFSRQDIWQYWDRQTRAIEWAERVSLVVRRLAPRLSIDTLLLDMPDEHIAIYDSGSFFSALKEQVETWRVRNGAAKVASFGGTHYWKYTNQKRLLSEIDFSLVLKNVA
jgi:hypothetical protein